MESDDENSQLNQKERVQEPEIQKQQYQDNIQNEDQNSQNDNFEHINQSQIADSLDQKGDQQSNNENSESSLSQQFVFQSDNQNINSTDEIQDEKQDIQQKKVDITGGFDVEQHQQQQEENEQEKQEKNQPWKPNTVFHQILDVPSLIPQGNIIPALIALKMGYQSINEKDQWGYTLLQHCAQTNLRDVAIFLIDNGADVAICNNVNQGLLHIVAKNNFPELFKFFLQQGCDYHGEDQYGFSPLLYAVQSRNIQLFCYLIYLGANYNVIDKNHCSVVHWAAYNDQTFLLKFFKQIGLEMHEVDNQGYTPFGRALINMSYSSVKYLAEDDISRVNIEKILQTNISWSINNTLLTLVKNQKQTFFKKILKLYSKIPQLYSFLIAVILDLLYAFVFFNSSAYKYTENIFQSVSFLLALVMFYYLWVMIFFSFNIGSATDPDLKPLNKRALDQQELNQTKQEFDLDSIQPYMKDIQYNEYKHMDFKHIDKLFEAQQQMSISITESSEDLIEKGKSLTDLTFLHELAILYETNRFVQIKSYNFDQICPLCFKYQAPGTAHCDVCNKCVKYFSHHSNYFGKCINASNHMAFLLVIIVQQIIMTLFIGLMFVYYYNKITSSFYWLWAELIYIMVTQENNYIRAFFMILGYFLYFYNTIYFCIEIYGIFHYMTRNEIYNNHRYKYLYYPVTDHKGQIIQKRRGPFENGVQNLKKYFQRAAIYTRVK